MISPIQTLDEESLPKEARSLLNEGRFSEAKAALLARAAAEPEKAGALADRVALIDRVALDYAKDAEAIAAEIRTSIPDLRQEELERWTAEGALEARLVDGGLRYFNRAVVNLYRLSAEARARKAACTGNAEPEAAPPDPGEPGAAFDMDRHMRRVLDAAKASGPGYVERVDMRFELGLTATPRAVPAGATLRCWLPFPREGGQHSRVQLKRSFPSVAAIAPSDAPHRCLYLEAPCAGPGRETLIGAAWDFDSSAYAPLVDPSRVEAYAPDSEAVRGFLDARDPHLALSPALRSLAAEIVGAETNPYRKARRLFGWMNDRVTYTAAPEYSTIPAISEYCLGRRRGDCGIQALLFIALCRASGVPARWQSGWTVAPGKVNLHDWARFYVEPYGWLPADPSRGLRDSSDPELRWFYFGNIDAYRMVVNDDYGRPLLPAKGYLRSETVDFQRGELEWDEGNLYFDEWDYDATVSYGRVE